MAVTERLWLNHEVQAARMRTNRIRVACFIARRCNRLQPDFRVFHVTDDFSSEIGAAWKKNKQGAEFLSVSLDDPSFPEKINYRLVKTGAEHGYTLLWERARVLASAAA